jgi:hypothetical protein
MGFKLTSLQPIEALISLKTYWHALLKAWPKHDPCQGIVRLRRPQLKIEMRACARVDKLLLSPSHIHR